LITKNLQKIRKKPTKKKRQGMKNALRKKFGKKKTYGFSFNGRRASLGQGEIGQSSIERGDQRMSAQWRFSGTL
jgi:hypothetical protein